MATKTISITENAYKRLVNYKRANESFSIVIERITQKKKLNDFYGVLSKKGGDKLEKAIGETRKVNRQKHELRNKWLVAELARS